MNEGSVIVALNLTHHTSLGEVVRNVIITSVQTTSSGRQFMTIAYLLTACVTSEV
jgi:hypothetical protein